MNRRRYWIALLLAALAVGAAPPKELTGEQLKERYGEAYVAYREARQAEAAGDDQLAADRYATLQGEPYADAGAVYRAGCLLRLGKLNEAGKLLEGFIGGAPDRLYRFEGWLLLARCRYLAGNGGKEAVAAARADLDQALARYAELYPKWEEEWRRQQNLPALLLLLRDDSPEERVKDDFGVETPLAMPGDRLWPGPERLVNRLSCPWYMGWMKSQLYLFAAYLALEAGEAEAARQHFASAKAALPLNSAVAQSYLERAGIGLQQGVWFFDREYARSFRAQAPQLKLGAFLTVTGAPADAAPLFEAVLDAPRARDEERAAAVLGLLACRLARGQVQAASDLLAKHGKTLQAGQLAESAALLSQYAW